MRVLPFAPLLCASLAWAQEAPEEEPPAEEATTDVAPEGPTRAEVDALAEKVEALTSVVEAQQEQLEAQKEVLESQRTDLAETKLAATKKKDLTFHVTGYYRARGHLWGAKWGPEKPVTGGLWDGQDTVGKYMNQRLRLGFRAQYKDLANLNVHVQALDNIVWGDNAGLARTALFAGEPSYTGIDGTEVPPIQVLRAWTEFRLPVGQIRVGRMPSQWGLGILVNDGDGFKNDFGEANYGNQFDRFLFATNPVSIVQAITKKEERKEIPLILAIAVDRLVEDPLVQYYGYACTPGIAQGNDRYDARCDNDGDGTTDLDHGFTEDRVATDRQGGWWADGADDAWEMVYALIYRGENVRYFGGIGKLNIGGYVIHRLQRESESNVVVPDVFIDAKVHGVEFAAEAVGIFGKTRAVTLPNGDPAADDPLAKTAAIASYVVKLGYEQPLWRVLLETGFASGDDNVNDELFTGRPMNPDYNVGFILYEEVLAEVTRRLWNGDSEGLRSRGGVYNSYYFNPRVYLTPGFPNDTTEVIAGAVLAWPHKPDGAVIRCRPEDAERFSCPRGDEDIKQMLGWELDLAVKHKFHEHIWVTLETGWAKATNRLPLETVGLNPTGNFWTLQSRVAWEF